MMNKDEILHLASNLYEEAFSANSYWSVIKQYHKNIRDNYDQMNCSPAFYQVIYQSLVEALFMTLAKLFDSDTCSNTIKTLLTEIKQIQESDFNEYVRQNYDFNNGKFQHEITQYEECFFKKQIFEQKEICNSVGIEYRSTLIDVSFEDYCELYTKRFHGLNKVKLNLGWQRNKIYAHNDKKQTLIMKAYITSSR